METVKIWIWTYWLFACFEFDILGSRSRLWFHKIQRIDDYFYPWYYIEDSQILFVYQWVAFLVALAPALWFLVYFVCFVRRFPHVWFAESFRIHSSFGFEDKWITSNWFAKVVKRPITVVNNIPSNCQDLFQGSTVYFFCLKCLSSVALCLAIIFAFNVIIIIRCLRGLLILLSVWGQLIIFFYFHFLCLIWHVIERYLWKPYTVRRWASNSQYWWSYGTLNF